VTVAIVTCSDDGDVPNIGHDAFCFVLAALILSHPSFCGSTTMEPRRSSRAASAKPASKTAAKPASKKAASEKPTSRPRSTANKKRAASPERADLPPPKRTKGEEQNIAPTREKPNSRTIAKTATEKRSRTKLAPIAEKDAPAPESKPPKPPHVQTKPYLNPLPTPPEKIRPGLQLFVWGAGNFGQFGLGPDVLDELDKPKKHSWAAQKMQGGVFGEEGAGLEEVAGGGMHSLFVDEKGTVCQRLFFFFSFLFDSHRINRSGPVD
jgi:regulator of chromosome condensation